MDSPTQVHQIMMNLCMNAVYSMEKDGDILTVCLNDIAVDSNLGKEMVDSRQGEYIKIEVSDTGSGIEPKILKKIFEPYLTTKELGEGTGMGLAVVHGIVESYHGKIIVSSQLGQGTTFSIYLPITKKRGAYRAYEPEDLHSGTENILSVDDEAPIAKMGARNLEELGYSVTTRTSSVEAF